MRSLITTHFVSLDGVAEAPGGEEGYRHTGWTQDIEPDPAQYEPKGREQEEATAFLMGGRSYADFAPVWPTLDFFAGWNAMPKYVVSSTVTDPQWHNTTVLPSLDDVRVLRKEGGKTGLWVRDEDRDDDRGGDPGEVGAVTHHADGDHR